MTDAFKQQIQAEARQAVEELALQAMRPERREAYTWQ